MNTFPFVSIHTRRVRKVTIHHVYADSEIFYAYCGNIVVDLDPLLVSRARLTVDLAGLWIGAAISNTSHSNKAGSTSVKRARITGKGLSSTAVLL
jgi:hypothetical protein